MGSSIETALGRILTAAGLGDAHEEAHEASKDPLVETLTAINPVLGLVLGSYQGITKSSSVSNPLFRNGDLSSGTEPKLLKVDEDKWPTDAEGLIALGQDYQNMGESFWAMEAFQKAAKADPNNHDSQFYLGQVYVEQGRGYDAEESLTAYIKENPKDPDARDLRAQANTLILQDMVPDSDEAVELLKKIHEDKAISLAASDPVSHDLDEAAKAKAEGNDAEFKKWSDQALSDAKAMPNGEALAVPMAEADLLALDGKFEEASKKYKALEASLQALSGSDSSIQEAIASVKQRHSGVLAAGVASGVLTFARLKKDCDWKGLPDAQRLATSCADELYLLDPSEKTLQTLVAAYGQVGLDLRALRTQIGQNKAKIQDLWNERTGLMPVSRALKMDRADQQRTLTFFGLPNIQPPTATPVDPIKELEAANDGGQDIINRTEAHFSDLIAQAHPDDTYQQHIEAATVFAIGGNNHKALDELQAARLQFKVGPVVVPSTPENIGKEITVLHRIVGVSGISYDLHDEVLKEARGLIKDLQKDNPDQAVLYAVENMELQASVNSDRGALGLSNPDADSDEQEAAGRRYHDSVRKGQMDIVDFCEKSLKGVKDPAAREQIGARMFQARANALELDLGQALVHFEEDKKDVAEYYASASLKEFNDFAAKYKDVPNAAGYAEGMGRARLAQAYYQFRTGKIEESIATLKAIKKDYPDSTASLEVSGRGYWPNESGIVDGDGNITDTDKEDVMAAITTAASKLNKEKGRGLAACGVGAGLFILGDLALGEKVSGVAVATACVGGFVLDRALLIAQSSNEIAASYRTGVSTATPGEALLATGEFVLNIACMYMGGAAGGFAEKLTLNAGSSLGGDLTGFLLSNGLKPGPWTRALGEFALTESSYAANALAFQKTSGLLNQTGSALMHGQMPSYKDTDTAEDYFVSWLFVRVMPMAMEANPGAKIIRDETAFDRSVQKAVNVGYGGAVVQELRGLATNDPSQVSLDKMGSTAWDLFFMHHGNRALESAVPMESLGKIGRDLDAGTLSHLDSIRKSIDDAPSSGSWWDKNFGWIKTNGTPPEPVAHSEDSTTTLDPTFARQAKPALKVDVATRPTGDGTTTEGTKTETPKPAVEEPVGKAGFEKHIKPYMDAEQWKAFESIFLSNDPKAIEGIRDEISKELNGSCKDLSGFTRAMKTVLERHGFNELNQVSKILKGSLDAKLDEAQISANVKAFSRLTGSVGLQFLPDNVPVYRVVNAEAVTRAADGSVTMAPNRFGTSYWGVGSDGVDVAKKYAESEPPPYVILKTTIGEMRKAGNLAFDKTALTGNALELHHEGGSENPTGIHAEVVANMPLPKRSLPKAPPRVSTPTAKETTAAAPKPASDPLGADALGFLADRGGMGLMARDPGRTADFFREQYGKENFEKVEFLFKNDDASRARVNDLRAKVAAKADGQYTDTASTMKNVYDVLKEQGIDFDQWRADRNKTLAAESKDADEDTLNRMHTDVLDGVLLMQLFPDEVPVYRTTSYPGESGQGGSSWWGVGDKGTEAAMSYWEPGRTMIRTTFGALRQAGAVRVDEMAVAGNSVELYQYEKNSGSGKPADAWTKVPFEEMEPIRLPQASKPMFAGGDALFGAAGPAVGFMAHSLGLSPTLSTLIGGASLLLPALGAIVSRSRPFSEPESMRPTNSQPVTLGLKNEATLREMTDASGRTGYTVRQNGVDLVLVNGAPLDPKSKWTWVKPGDVVDTGGKIYVIESVYPKQPKIVDDMQRQARRPYKMDDSFQQMNGRDAAGSFKRTSGLDADGRFVSVVTDDGHRVSVAIEGSGRAPAQLGSAAETESVLPDWIQGGHTLATVLNGAKTHVQESYAKDDGTLRAGAPKLETTGVEIKPVEGDSQKFEGTFVRNGGIEAIVVRLGGSNTPVFDAPAGVSDKVPLKINDVIVTGHFTDGMSETIVMDIVKRPGMNTAEAIRDALQQEALIRNELLRALPNGGRITHQNYVDAYARVVGRTPPADFKGYYETNYELLPNGDIRNVSKGYVVDHFSNKAGGFMVQIVGK